MTDINVGAISEALNNKADRDLNNTDVQSRFDNKANTNLSNVPSAYDYVVESYKSGHSWYRRYKSGWVEQGGQIGKITSNSVENITLPIEMNAVSYSILISTRCNDGEETTGRVGVIGKTITTTGFKIVNQGWSTSYNGINIMWQVKGYAA